MEPATESRNGKILLSIIENTPYTDPPQSRIEELLIELKEIIEAGGGGGATSYEGLTGKPKINGYTLSGDVSLSDIGAASENALAEKQDEINDLAAIRSGAASGATAVQPAALQNAVQGLQTDISDETAAREAADSEMQDAISEDRAALVELVDEGAKNVLNSIATTGSSGSLSWTVASDGTITVNGTNDTSGRVDIHLFGIGYLPNIYSGMLLSGCKNGSSSGQNQYYILALYSNDGIAWESEKAQYDAPIIIKDSPYCRISIMVPKDSTLNNVVFKPMICTKAEWDVSHKYVPYAKTNSDLTVLTDEDRDALVEIVDGGAKNGLKFDAIGSTTYGTTYESNGVKFTLNADNTVTFERISASSSAANCTVALNGTRLDVLSYCDGNHILSGCPSGGGSSSYEIMATVSGGAYTKRDYGTGVILDSVSGVAPYVQLTVRSGFTGTAAFKPMICTQTAWKISKTFQPYRPSWQEMWDAIQALQNGGASTQSASTASLMSVKPTIEPDVMPEEGEKQDE